MKRDVQRDHYQVLHALNDLKWSSGHRYMKYCIGVPKTGPQGEKHGFFGVNFEDLLLDIFENFFLSNFFTNVHLIPGFRGHRSSLKLW